MATEPDAATPEARRRRRLPRVPKQVVAFLGVLCAGVLIGWVIFRDDETAPAPDASTVSGQKVAADARVYPKLGIALDLPKQWKTAFRGSVLTAVGRDSTVSIALSVAGGGNIGQRIRRIDRSELARLFKAKEISRSRAKVGSETTIVTELIGRARNGRPLRILSMGPSSRWRTYSIQAFTVLRPGARQIAELRTLLASIRYRQPS